MFEIKIFALGEQAPNFKLPAVSGGIYDFYEDQKEHEGDWHLLINFRGSWCPVCMEELKELEASKGYFEGKNVHIKLISTDYMDDLEEMVKEHGFTSPVLADEELSFLNKYGVHYHTEDDPYEDHGEHGEPAYFLVSDKGEILYQQRQTNPFGRPAPTELRKVVAYIQKNMK